MRSNAMPLQVMLLACIIAVVAAQIKPSYNSTCGDVNIPYPFGTSEACYRDEDFLITCNNSTSSGKPIAYHGRDIQVLNISLSGELRVLGDVCQDCYDRNGQPQEENLFLYG